MPVIKPPPAPPPAPPVEPAQSFATSTKTTEGRPTVVVPGVNVPPQPAPEPEPAPKTFEPNEAYKAAIATEQWTGAAAVKVNASRREAEIELGKQMVAARQKNAEPPAE